MGISSNAVEMAQPVFLRNKETGELVQIEPPPTPKPKNLVQKLCEVMASIDPVAKKGENKFHGYKYAKESDIVEAIRGELSKRTVFIFPNIVSHTRTGDVTDIMVEWTFVDGDSGETRTCIFPGCGADKSDKGVYKALTGSEKYFLMKSFLIPTGDDPEKDNKDEIEDARQKANNIAKDKIAKLKAGVEGNVNPKDFVDAGREAFLAGKDYVPSLFYTWHDESQSAEISGAEQLKTLHKPYLKQYWNPSARAIVVNAEQLENMKYELEKRGVPFHPLKAM